MATHAVRHTDYSLETHSFFSYHLGDTLLPLFVICSRHMTSSSHGLSDTRIPPDSWGTVVAAWRHTQQAFLTHREFICIGDSRPLLFICVSDSRLIGNTCRHRQHTPEFSCCVVVAHLQTRSSSSSFVNFNRSDTRIFLCDPTHGSFFFSYGDKRRVFFFVNSFSIGTQPIPSLSPCY